MSKLRYAILGFVVCYFPAAFGVVLCAQAPEVTATPLVTQPVRRDERVALQNSVHPLATAANDVGPVSADEPVKRAMLLLQRPPERQAALDSYLADVQAKGNPRYHHWLTPDEFGKKFGPAESDVEAVKAWLQSEGLAIERLSSSRRVVEFSGTAGQVNTAFATRLDRFKVNGVSHVANAISVQVPEALAKSIAAVAPLGDFAPSVQVTQGKQGQFHKSAAALRPQWTQTGSTGTFYALAPADLAMQYDLTPAYAAGTNGAGEKIGIIGESNINTAVTDAFRSTFGLAKAPVQVIVDGADPGIIDNPTEGFDHDINSDPTVSYMGVETAGSMAPGAQVMLYVSAGSEYQDPLLLAAQRAVDDDQADVLSFGYSECEYFLGMGNALYAALWEQAAAQGQTVVAADGEFGSAGCVDSYGYGLMPSGMASTPWDIAVGGTDFFYSDYATGGTSAAGMWNAANDPATKGSLKAPLPEQVWNDSLGLNAAPVSAIASNYYAGGGGASSCSIMDQPAGGAFPQCISGYAKPAWQQGHGVPQDGVRDTPDVSLFAADGQNLSAYAICVFAQDCVPDPNGNFSTELVGGTSAAAPAMAGILALVDQKYGRQGQAAPVLYELASKVPGVFRDVTKGSNRLPCTLSPGFSECVVGLNGNGQLTGDDAAPGYDLASGLGSVDAWQLISHWGDVTAKSSVTTLQISPLQIPHGQSATASVKVTGSDGGTPTGDVALLSNTALPAQQGQGEITLTAGAGAKTLATLPGGTYQLTGRYGGDGVYGSSTSSPVSVTVTPETSNINFAAELTGHYYGFAPFQPGETMGYGQPVQLLVHPTGAMSNGGAATGSATFTLNNTTYSAGLNAGGYASWTPQALPVGQYTASATYSGDPSYSASSSSKLPFTVQLGIPGVVLQSNMNSILHVGDSLTVGVQVGTQQLQAPGTLAPTGQVIVGFGTCNPYYSGLLSDAVSAPLTVPAGASSTVSSALVTLPNLQTSYQCLWTEYLGDSNWDSESTIFVPGLTILPTAGISTQTTLQVSATNISGGQTTSLLATVTGPPGSSTAPTGSVTFLDNGTNGGGSYSLSANLVPGKGATSTATLTHQPASNFLNSGSNQLIALYSGDSVYSSSTSAPVTLTATQPGGDFLLDASVTQMTLAAGKTGTVSLNMTALQGFSGTVALSCSTSAPTATCVISPAMVALSSLSTATLTFNAYTQKATISSRSSLMAMATVTLFGVMTLFFLPGRRSKFWTLTMSLALATSAGLSGCGNGVKPGTPSTPPGTTPATQGSYAVAVVAKSGPIVHNVTVLVTIQ